RHIDDYAVPVLEHVRQNRLHAIESALDVERERALEQRIIDVEKLRSPQRSTRRVELKLHASKRLDRSVHHIVDLSARGNVGRMRQRLATLAEDPIGGLFGALGIDVGADDICALARKGHCSSAADAARRAGNDDRLADEIIRSLWHRMAPRACRAIVSLVFAKTATQASNDTHFRCAPGMRKAQGIALLSSTFLTPPLRRSRARACPSARFRKR